MLTVLFHDKKFWHNHPHDDDPGFVELTLERWADPEAGEFRYVMAWEVYIYSDPAQTIRGAKTWHPWEATRRADAANIVREAIKKFDELVNAHPAEHGKAE